MTDAIQEDVSHVLNVNEAAEKILAMDAPEPSEAESTEEETEEPEQEEPEKESEEETEEVSVEEEPEADVTDEETSSFVSELNDYLTSADKGILDTIKVPTKVNGEEKEATLAEIVRSYQLGENFDQKTDSLTTEREAFSKEQEAKRIEYSQSLSSAASLVNQLEQQLVQSAEKVDWDELRQSDPAEFAAKKQELIERQQQYQSARTTLAKEHQTKFNEHVNSVLDRESKALVREIPGWNDESVAKAEMKTIRDFLLKEGFTSIEIDGQSDNDGNILSAGMSDHRAIKMARKAMLYDAGDKKVEVAKKRVRTLPKVARPGKQVSKADKDSDRSKQMRGKLKKSGKVEDAAALIMDKLFGGP
jgi:hypothetical protein